MDTVADTAPGGGGALKRPRSGSPAPHGSDGTPSSPAKTPRVDAAHSDNDDSDKEEELDVHEQVRNAVQQWVQPSAQQNAPVFLKESLDASVHVLRVSGLMADDVAPQASEGLRLAALKAYAVVEAHGQAYIQQYHAQPPTYQLLGALRRVVAAVDDDDNDAVSDAVAGLASAIGTSYDITMDADDTETTDAAAAVVDAPNPKAHAASGRTDAEHGSAPPLLRSDVDVHAMLADAHDVLQRWDAVTAAYPGGVPPHGLGDVHAFQEGVYDNAAHLMRAAGEPVLRHGVLLLLSPRRAARLQDALDMTLTSRTTRGAARSTVRLTECVDTQAAQEALAFALRCAMRDMRQHTHSALGDAVARACTGMHDAVRAGDGAGIVQCAAQLVHALQGAVPSVHALARTPAQPSIPGMPSPTPSRRRAPSDTSDSEASFRPSDDSDSSDSDSSDSDSSDSDSSAAPTPAAATTAAAPIATAVTKSEKLARMRAIAAKVTADAKIKVAHALRGVLVGHSPDAGAPPTRHMHDDAVSVDSADSSSVRAPSGGVPHTHGTSNTDTRAGVSTPTQVSSSGTSPSPRDDDGGLEAMARRALDSMAAEEADAPLIVGGTRRAPTHPVAPHATAPAAAPTRQSEQPRMSAAERAALRRAVCGAQQAQRAGAAERAERARRDAETAQMQEAAKEALQSLTQDEWQLIQSMRHDQPNAGTRGAPETNPNASDAAPHKRGSTLTAHARATGVEGRRGVAHASLALHTDHGLQCCSTAYPRDTREPPVPKQGLVGDRAVADSAAAASRAALTRVNDELRASRDGLQAHLRRVRKQYRGTLPRHTAAERDGDRGAPEAREAREWYDANVNTWVRHMASCLNMVGLALHPHASVDNVAWHKLLDPTVVRAAVARREGAVST